LSLYNVNYKRFVGEHFDRVHGGIQSICWLSDYAFAFGCLNGTLHVYEKMADNHQASSAFMVLTQELSTVISGNILSTHNGEGQQYLSKHRRYKLLFRNSPNCCCRLRIYPGMDCRRRLYVFWPFHYHLTHACLGSLTDVSAELVASPYIPRFIRFIESGKRVIVGYLDTREMWVIRFLESCHEK